MMQFDSARWMQDSGGVWLCLHVTAPAAAKEFCGKMEPKLYDADLKVHREKRSLDANAYFWVLAGKLAAKLGITPEEIYRAYVPDVAGNYEVVPVREDRITAWEKLWCGGHIGRMVEDIGPCRNTAGYHNIRSFIGSSDYDTAQMARLIDLVVSDCKEQDIETLPPDKLDAMKLDWRINERI
ncbi:hypothetical protein [Oscillibacter sp.]|uniref:hypothetical protein n=1 Tax=Oscillibacter sp. TaxID=1945593 RepID=UPI00289AD0B6|nr:hypothetical protein [Oscillibacter sp.]